LSPIAALRLIVQRHLVGTTLKGFVLGVLKLGTYWTCYTWLPKFLQTEFHQPIGRSALWMLTAQVGQFAGMLVFGYLADKFGRRVLFTVYSCVTAASLYPLAFHWLFPTDIRNFTMGTVYNTARGVQFFAPFLVSYFVAGFGLAGGLGVPLVLALATATWVWTLPETRHRNLAEIAK
jgi:MFS family permease